ncbi:drebrin-like protein [Prorops nasuta]|uniref:drebrin-like protein n=1 Tax=Prorops nasuta TaxID=863751 RepID=UPI0034CDA6B9
MSLNTSKNKDSLVAAWQKVVDDKSSTNWALFGYEDQTNVLKVVGTGNGGLEELIDRLNSCFILYAFCRVVDIKTSLQKCLLINWQGEGAPIVRKGTCANHIRDVEKLLKGAHITITARSEDDVEVDLIMEKLARATASAFRFNEPRTENDGQTGPIGTTYRRVIPEQEINTMERDQFWKKDELEEKGRIIKEKNKLEEERKKLEAEIRIREEREELLREQQALAKENSIARYKEAEKRAEEAENLRNQVSMNQHFNNDIEDDHKSRSEELRRQRSKEAQQLIAQRTINARAIFEQNSAAGQMKSLNQQYPQKGNHAEAALKIIPESKNIEPVVIKSEEKISTEKHKTVVEAPSKNSNNAVSPVPAVSQVTQVTQATLVSQQAIQEAVTNTQEIDQIKIMQNETTENELCNQLDGTYLYFDPNNEGMKARALYDYQAADDTEITFDPGDIITHIDMIDEGWWQGLGPDGTYGLFPANYVEVIES